VKKAIKRSVYNYIDSIYLPESFVALGYFAAIGFDFPEEVARLHA
jgi:hypothetical protein